MPTCWQHLGVGRGVVVGIHLPQCPENLIAHVAIQKLGGIALPLFNLFGPDAIGYRLADSGARVLITTPAALERTEQALQAVDTLRHIVTVGARSARGPHEFLVPAGGGRQRRADGGNGRG